MTTRRVALASFILLVLLLACSYLPGQRSPVASAQPQGVARETIRNGRIEISTTPDASLSIDGQPAGETADYARLITLPEGEHTIAVEFPGGQRWSQSVSVRGGERKCISLVYQPKSPGSAASNVTPPAPPSTQDGEFRQGDIFGRIYDCGRIPITRGGRAPAPEEPRILRSSPAPTGLPQDNSAQKTLPPPRPLPPPPSDEGPAEAVPPKKADEKKENEDYTIVPIFYGTDRKRTGANEPGEFYGAGRGKLEMGMCEVSIPKTHQRGRLESPSIWRLEFREDPKLHVVLLSVKPLEAADFNSQFQSQLGAAKSRDVFVFVHGYNVKFVDAARRTAQLAYDLDFPGVAVLYSWPSQGTLSGYTTDENEVVWTEPHLKKFLADLAAQGASGARIHLVAHSMGNRALTNVLRTLATESSTPIFSEVVLTAPDIDAEVFERDLAPAIQKIARRVTLYASSSDAALMASKKVHGYQRAGDSAPTIIIAPGIDTIDASGIDTDLLGHSYFAQMKDVLQDINLLLIASKSPAERSLLEQARAAGKYWRLASAVVPPGEGTRKLPGAGFLNLRYALLLAVFLVACAVAVWVILRAKRRAAN